MKLVHKFEQTKALLEEKLKLWKKEETEMLKKQMKEKEMGQLQAGKKGRRGRPLSNAFEEDLTPLRMEMKSFELLGDEKEGVDMLEWWKIHSNMFPLLSFLARIVFAVSAASSKSERVFSAAGSVLSI